MTDEAARWPCWAKVNLTLEVLRRRDDGYHELASLMQTIELADELRVEPATTIEISNVGERVDADADLVWRAARELASATAVQAGARLTLTKRIPLAAGLGGGSSDAATALLALDQLWDTRLSLAELTRLGLRLGSDVPFLLHGGLALVGGRGEHVEPLAVAVEQWLALLVPRHELHAKTAALFRALEPADFSDGAATADLARRLRSAARLADADLLNAFEAPARRTFVGLDALWRSAEALSGRPLHLSGAGPALFALAQDEADATRVASRLAALGERVFVAAFVQPDHTRDRYAPARPIRYA
ncbi:MAG: 4-(cytidine 5'-diphospho)-2-C-methyl-D-erythritol kinase [Chloroflexi bacterium]|nr:4-(cytidine 5'-diphospho)-2-C-methyl-D-erythritol kinase [Chloroflexota bacterium]